MFMGNPGAITVFRFILEEYPEKSLMIFEKMKELRLYDYHIWIKYKECGKDVHKFVEYVEKTNP